MGSNHDNLNKRRICKLQGFQWSRMPDWTKKKHSYTTSTRPESNPPPRHWLPDERPRRVVGIGSPGEITLAVRFFWGKCFLFNVAIKEARPCSAQAQNTLSSGSGERLSSLRMVANSASSLSRLMISPTRFRLTPSLLRTPLYSERISSVTNHVNVPTSIQSRINGALGFLHHPPVFESGYSSNKYRHVDYTSRLFSSAAQS